jgi:hypothetical protein
MVYPAKVISSVSFEAGYALDHCAFSVYFVKEPEDLPYLTRRLPDFAANVRMIKYETEDDIVSIIKRHGIRLFSNSLPGVG